MTSAAAAASLVVETGIKGIFSGSITLVGAITTAQGLTLPARDHPPATAQRRSPPARPVPLRGRLLVKAGLTRDSLFIMAGRDVGLLALAAFVTKHATHTETHTGAAGFVIGVTAQNNARTVSAIPILTKSTETGSPGMLNSGTVRPVNRHVCMSPVNNSGDVAASPHSIRMSSTHRHPPPVVPTHTVPVLTVPRASTVVGLYVGLRGVRGAASRPARRHVVPMGRHTGAANITLHDHPPTGEVGPADVTVGSGTTTTRNSLRGGGTKMPVRVATYGAVLVPDVLTPSPGQAAR